jgi:hypothetical protein
VVSCGESENFSWCAVQSQSLHCVSWDVVASRERAVVSREILVGVPFKVNLCIVCLCKF